MAVEAEIKTEHDPDAPKDYAWTASITTEDYGTFYGYGKDKGSAIKDAEMEMNYWTSKNG